MSEHTDLERRLTELGIGVSGLKGSLDHVARVLQQDVNDLQHELSVQRRLAKYARRTWFEVMTWIALTTLYVSDVARAYCTPSNPALRRLASPLAPQVCDTVFWTTDHGGHPLYRVLGLALTLALLVWLARRSQVPADLEDRVPANDFGRRERWWKRV